MKKRSIVKKFDVEETLDELRILVGKMDIAVYRINICKAGYGILFCKSSDSGIPTASDLWVNRYYPTLGEAVEGELEGMIKEYERKQASKRVLPAGSFVGTLAENVENKKITAVEFREFVRRTLPIVNYDGAR